MRSAVDLTGKEVGDRLQARLNREGFHHLYIHIPFCRHKCGYCDFNAYAGLDGLIEPYVAALEQELIWAASRFEFGVLGSIYFGGGTPSLIPGESIQRLLRRIRSLFRVAPDAEITLEANPASTDGDKLQTWLAAGVNRLSLGVQGFDPKTLAVLERRTDGAQAEAAIRMARSAGMENLSLDLIYAVPFQTLNAWQQTLDRALALEPEHLSCYCLTLEEGTPLRRRQLHGQLPSVDPDDQWRFIERCRSSLIGAGYRRYEVSSWAKPGRESRHNRSYWSCRPVYGAGCGAHSYLPLVAGALRWWNWSRPADYIRWSRSDEFFAAGEELSAAAAAAERTMLGLRCTDGVAVAEAPPDVVDHLSAAGLVTASDGRVTPTERGLDLHNQIALALL